MIYLSQVAADVGPFIATAPALAFAPIIGAMFGMAIASFARDVGVQTWRS
jgi:hypothetical protein